MRQSSPKSSQAGMALIEAMVAIFIFSIGILAVIGMQAVAVRTASDAKYRADAAFLADQIIGQMWSDQGTPNQANLASYVTGAATVALALGCNTTVTTTANANGLAWLRTVASTLPGADITRQSIQITNTNQVTVTICWQTAPGATSYHNHVITARINNNS
mgnify:FL=1